jgi:tripartite-type tricarboxylate transporter receptor subunit TctC
VDGIGRIIAHALEERLKVSVFVDNKAGANGTIAMSFSQSKSKPDGYTLI